MQFYFLAQNKVTNLNEFLCCRENELLKTTVFRRDEFLRLVMLRWLACEVDFSHPTKTRLGFMSQISRKVVLRDDEPRWKSWNGQWLPLRGQRLFAHCVFPVYNNISHGFCWLLAWSLSVLSNVGTSFRRELICLDPEGPSRALGQAEPPQWTVKGCFMLCSCCSSVDKETIPNTSHVSRPTDQIFDPPLCGEVVKSVVMVLKKAAIWKPELK